MDKGIAMEEFKKSIGLEEVDKIKSIIKESVLPKLRDRFKKLKIDFQIYDNYLVFYINHLAFLDMDHAISFEIRNCNIDRVNKEDISKYLVDYISINLKRKWESYILKEDKQ